MALLDWYRTRRQSELPWRLVIAGDLVDFVRLIPNLFQDVLESAIGWSSTPNLHDTVSDSTAGWLRVRGVEIACPRNESSRQPTQSQKNSSFHSCFQHKESGTGLNSESEEAGASRLCRSPRTLETDSFGNSGGIDESERGDYRDTLVAG